MEEVKNKMNKVSGRGIREIKGIPTCLRIYTARRTLWFSLVLATAILLMAGIALARRGQAGGQVEGAVFAQVQDKQLPLSGITVYVENVFTSTPSQKVTTDLNGRFAVPEQSSGTYQLCWEAPGFIAECSPDLFVIENSTVFLSPTEITPEGGVVSGRVTLADGTLCHYFDPFFGVDVSTSVALVDGMGAEVAGPVLANASSDYLLTNVPSGTFRLIATCEAALAEETLTTSETGTIVMDLTFENESPVVSDVVATIDGKPVYGVPKGTTVEVTANATDIDGDPLHYEWATPVPGLTSDDSPTVQWTLPESRGLHTLYVLVSDGRGGYQMSRVEISTDGGVVFSSVAKTSRQSYSVSALSTSLTASSTPADRAEARGIIFLTFKGTDDAKSACEYYKAIGAITNSDKDCDSNPHLEPGDGITFNGWKRTNGLAINPDANRNGNQFDDDRITGEASALYLNFVDLNIARSMHGKKAVVGGQERVAYYVCNYPTLKDARRNRNLQACVAFDYSASEPFTKFYVFGPGGNLLPTADLDTKGQKFVPGLCVACHGGDTYSGKFITPVDSQGNPGNIGAHFLPFDLFNFKYLDDSTSFNKAAQQDKFKRLNQMILDTTPTAAVRELIEGWYSGGRDTQDNSFIPTGWKRQPTGSSVSSEVLYSAVVERSCRSCHVATRSVRQFNEFQFFKILATRIRDLVCRDYKMPNARQTFNLFWLQSGSFSPLDTLETFLRGQPGLEKTKCFQPQ